MCERHPPEGGTEAERELEAEQELAISGVCEVPRSNYLLEGFRGYQVDSTSASARRS